MEETRRTSLEAMAVGTLEHHVGSLTTLHVGYRHIIRGQARRSVDLAGSPGWMIEVVLGGVELETRRVQWGWHVMMRPAGWSRPLLDPATATGLWELLGWGACDRCAFLDGRACAVQALGVSLWDEPLAPLPDPEAMADRIVQVVQAAVPVLAAWHGLREAVEGADLGRLPDAPWTGGLSR